MPCGIMVELNGKDPRVGVSVEQRGRTSLDTETGLAPVSPLGVVSKKKREDVSRLFFGLTCLTIAVCACPNQRISPEDLFHLVFDSDRAITVESFERSIDVSDSFSFPITVPPLPHTGREKRAYRLARLYSPDGVTGPETDPLRDGTVLLLSFGKLLLGTETLLALYRIYLR